MLHFFLITTGIIFKCFHPYSYFIHKRDAGLCVCVCVCVCVRACTRVIFSTFCINVLYQTILVGNEWPPHRYSHLWVSAWSITVRRAAWPKLDSDMREKQTFTGESHRNVRILITAASISLPNSYILLISGPVISLGDLWVCIDDLQTLASQFLVVTTPFPLLPFSYSPRACHPLEPLFLDN